MAITIDRPSGVITIPKADTILVSAGPPEIRRLDTDAFRKILRDLDDDEDGRAWPHTHDHNTEVTISGVTYARQVLIRPPYTVTFGLPADYAVIIDGSNNNIIDVANFNGVSIVPTNSAGLINIDELLAQFLTRNQFIALK